MAITLAFQKHISSSPVLHFIILS